jgi:predicted HAD superfamily hydrolase
MSHRINLVVQTLSKMGIVRKIEDVMQSLYACFFHNPNRTQKFVDLVHIVETRVNEF